MIVEERIILGLGTVSVGFLNSEPNKMYFVEHRIGTYQVGEKTSNCLEEGSEVKTVIEFGNLKTPLEMVQRLRQVKNEGGNTVTFINEDKDSSNKIIFDFSRIVDETPWKIVEGWFFNAYEKMGKSKGLNNLDLLNIIDMMGLIL